MKPVELDLALAELPANRWFGWIVGTLVAVAVLALAVVAAADAVLREARLRPVTVTVALPAGDGAAEAAVREALTRLPDVLAVEPVPAAELGALLAAEDAGGDGLPLPRLLDLVFRPGVDPDMAGLRRKLAEIAPGAVASDPAADGRPALARAEALRLLGLGVLGLVTVTAVIFAAATVRANVRLQAETVDLLRLMGASDRYIARQFEHFVLARGLGAAIAGFTVAVASFLAAVAGGRALWPHLLGGVALRPLDWVALAAVPVALVLLLALTARLTAGRALIRALPA